MNYNFPMGVLEGILSGLLLASPLATAEDYPSYKCCYNTKGALNCQSGYSEVQQTSKQFVSTEVTEKDCGQTKMQFFVTADDKVHALRPNEYKCCSSGSGVYSCKNSYGEIQQQKGIFQSDAKSADVCAGSNLDGYVTNNGIVHSVLPKTYKCCGDQGLVDNCSVGYGKDQQLEHVFTTWSVALSECKGLNLKYVIAPDGRVKDSIPQYPKIGGPPSGTFE